ncbi:hypothetical protein [Delftia acidovorans]
MTHILIPREPSTALLRPFIGCNTQELHEAWAAMVRIAEVQHARADSQCLAQIEEPARPVAEICSASHDDAQFGERAIKPLCDISGFEYGTQLYAGAAPAAVAPFGYVNTHTGQFFTDVEPCRQGNEGHWRTVYLQPAAVAGPALDVRAIAAAVCQRVAELPDRDSPEDWPEAMLVTGAELIDAVADEIEQALSQTAAAARPAPATFMTEDRALEWAWDKVREDLGTKGWTAGDFGNFHGFFLHGWNYRGQYDLQRSTAMAALKQELKTAAPALEAPAAPAVPLNATPEMRAAFRRAYREGGFWADRIDYALDQMLAAAPQAPAAPRVVVVDWEMEDRDPVEMLDKIYAVYQRSMGKPAPDAEMAEVVELTKDMLLAWWGEHREDIRAAMAAAQDQTAGAAPVGGLEGWAIDKSTGTDILVYKGCSVIEDEHAHRLLALLSAAPAAPSADERAAYIEFLTGKFPRSYGKEEAGRWWDQGHVSALAWQAARAVAAAPAAPAEAQRLAQFLQDRQTCLGSSRASAGKYNQQSWDDYERAWTMLLGMAAPAAPAVDAETIHLQDLKNALAECQELRQQITLMDEQQAGTVWRWQADGQDQLASMGNRMGVLIYACDLRALLAGTAPAVDASELEWLTKDGRAHGFRVLQTIEGAVITHSTESLRASTAAAQAKEGGA